MRFIEEIDIFKKKVFIRVDFNVPMKNGEVTDDTRIKAGIETIEYALKQEAVVVLASHLGRPKSFDDKEFSLKPVAEKLSKILGKDVIMAPDCIGDNVKRIIDRSQSGDIIMLENLRFHPEEKKDDEDFAKRLASLCDVYINNAFAVSHRKNASVSKIVEFSSFSGAGHLLKSEIENYSNAVDSPNRPLTAIIGGAKVSSKLNALKNILNKVDKVIIGGAMANTFFKAKGIYIGDSLYEEDMIKSAQEIMETAKKNNVDLFLPIDCVVSNKIEPGAKCKDISLGDVPKGFQILDIGSKSLELFKGALKDAKTIVWNGPMGVFEIDEFAKGTMGLAGAVAESGGYTIVGGGDTDAAVHGAGLADEIDYISTGGGAFLTLMEGKPLPAVSILDNRAKNEDR